MLWFTQELYVDAIGLARKSQELGGHFGDLIPQYIREKTAVCLAWNDFTLLSVMHIPTGETLNAFTSTINVQPIVSSSDVERVNKNAQDLKLKSFYGGACQFWLWPVPEWINIKPNFLNRNIGT